jgi:hypothetical protein
MTDGAFLKVGRTVMKMSQGVEAVGTDDDFLTIAAPPVGTSHLISNPPYGENRRGEMAECFNAQALSLPVRHVAMLARANAGGAFRGCL